MVLTKYREKRKFAKTPEPEGKKKPLKGALQFVVQKHAASHLHYDLRLEIDGVLKSWAVPKGPSLDPQVKRLAIMVEDHPFDYKNFEGIIPEGNYGAGTVIVWDEGNYYSIENKDPVEGEEILKRGLQKGHITFFLEGTKLKGAFSLVKIRSRGENTWLLVKKDDEYASKKDITKDDSSVKSGKTLKEISEKKDERMPHAIKPMLAMPVKEPFDHPDWVFENKWDGYRAIAEIENSKVHLYSRNYISFNYKFPSVARALEKLNFNTILDGEIVALDKHGHSKFQLIQNYQNNSDGNIVYYVFDMLYLNGHDMRGLTLLQRKEILKQALPKNKVIIYSDHIEEKGISFFEEACTNKSEGIIAKKSNSSYITGKRTKEWLKIKTHQRQEAVIGGITAPRGSRKDFGALVLGVYEKNELKYIGHTGGGFNEKSLKEIKKKLEPLFINTSPFKKIPLTNTPVTWVEPKLVCEVSFLEWTKEGVMRQPVFIGLREDKDTKSIVREKEISPELILNEPGMKTINATKKIKSKIAKTVHNVTKGTKPVNKEIMVNKHKLKLTNLEKIYWPDEKYTKGDIIAYYDEISDYILPYLKDRPQSLNRYPNGIYGESFYQKDVGDMPPEWVKTIEITSGSEDKIVNYLVCQDKATLLYMANLGCIEINPWSSRIKSLDKPDFMIIDLDPLDISFQYVIEVAQVVKEILDKAGAESFCKTSGATGLHIYVPLGAKYDYEQSRDFAHIIAKLAQSELPGISSIERKPAKRKKKVYIDYLQNSRGQTLAAPYCVRPQPCATVSAPLKWTEVKKGLDPSDFTIKNIQDRLKKTGDIFKSVLGKGINLNNCLNNLNKDL